MYFEIDYNLAVEEYKDILNEDDDKLSEDDRFIKQEQKKFMDQMFKEQFPDIIEIVLIYTQRESKHYQLVQEINHKILQLVLDIMKDKNDFVNIFKKLKNYTRTSKNMA